MCFSAEASLGVSVVLLPVGGYCVATAAHKDRAYLPLAAVPLLFGVQQFCEAGVWAGVERGDPLLTRVASRWFLLFALALWPAWVPLAVAAVEPGGPRRRVFLALGGLGLALGCVCYLPLAGGAVDVRVVGHFLRYDFSDVPAVRADPGWVWPALYLAAVCGPLAATGNRRLRPLGAAVAASAAVAYLAFGEAFASVWCFLAAALSAYIGYALHRLPEPPPGGSETRTPAPAH
jgi:uncharacterized protein DUF6629